MRKHHDRDEHGPAVGWEARHCRTQGVLDPVDSKGQGAVPRPQIQAHGDLAAGQHRWPASRAPCPASFERARREGERPHPRQRLASHRRPHGNADSARVRVHSASHGGQLHLVNSSRNEIDVDRHSCLGRFGGRNCTSPLGELDNLGAKAGIEHEGGGVTTLRACCWLAWRGCARGLCSCRRCATIGSLSRLCSVALPLKRFDNGAGTAGRVAERLAMRKACKGVQWHLRPGQQKEAPFARWVDVDDVNAALVLTAAEAERFDSVSQPPDLHGAVGPIAHRFHPAKL
mmetsp:Transcript_1039/g.3982  ORF Transcript_1039/g.3982 Transcript_1039/m.3982 type:complete len:287 (-) Transcript_1039:3608-4468(-)